MKSDAAANWNRVLSVDHDPDNRAEAGELEFILELYPTIASLYSLDLGDKNGTTLQKIKSTVVIS